MRGRQQDQSYLDSILNHLYTYLLPKIKNPSHSYAQGEINLLKQLAQAPIKVDAIPKIIDSSLIDHQIINAMQNKQHLIFRQDQNLFISEYGRLLLEELCEEF